MSINSPSISCDFSVTWRVSHGRKRLGFSVFRVYIVNRIHSIHINLNSWEPNTFSSPVQALGFLRVLTRSVYIIMFCVLYFKLLYQTDCSVPSRFQNCSVRAYFFHIFGQPFGSRSVKPGVLSKFGKLFFVTRCSVNVWRVVLKIHFALATFRKVVLNRTDNCTRFGRLFFFEQTF